MRSSRLTPGYLGGGELCADARLVEVAAPGG
jgi:hypothetical protein